MNRYLKAGLVAIALALAIPGTAHATDLPGPEVLSTCLTGWYVNPDEADNAPVSTEAGLRFDGKDLVHHQTRPLDLADVRKGTFVAAGDAGKVLFKMETTAPYSSIIVTEDGKFWSTAMTYDQEGGQGHPVATVAEFVGKPTKPGKPALTADTKVVTFGVGYAVEPGKTVVSAITFHGTRYDLTCPPPKPSGSASPSTSASATPTRSVRPTASSSTPPAAGNAGGSTSDGGGLPVTGPGVAIAVGVGLILLSSGAVVFYFSRRRNTRFEA